MGESYAEKFNEIFDDIALPPEVTNRFHVIELLASNELSDTYLLSCKKTGRRYVLKRFQHTQLHSESELLGSLKHRGLPAFEPHIIDSGKLYTLREYIEGIPFDEFLREQPDDNKSDTIIQILIDLCDAITLLHSQPTPIIHRDIKPSNIIINTKEMYATLIDFGISRKYKEESPKDTVIVATHGFSPPEQYGFAQSDNRTDIYSLGTVLRYCLTGTTDRDVPIADDELNRIVTKSTALAPEARYQTIEELKAALIKYERFFRSSPVAGSADKPGSFSTPEGYDAHDYGKLAKFFSFDENKLIIHTMYVGFTIEDPRTWNYTAKVDAEKTGFRITWNEKIIPKRIEGIYITDVDLSGDLDLQGLSALKNAEISETGITSLDMTGCTSIERLRCCESKLTTLSVKGCTSLYFLSCFDNELTELDVTDCTKLKELWCHYNKITRLYITGLKELRILHCARNRFTGIDLPELTGLVELHAWANRNIIDLDLSGNLKLELLTITAIGGLDKLDLSKNSRLKNLWCGANDLTELITPQDSDLMYISAGSNRLTCLRPYVDLEKLCFFDISINHLKLNDPEIQSSISAIQATIDKNEKNPPDDYDPVWDKKIFEFKYDEQIS